MGNCANSCSNCMGKNGEHGEFNMDSQSAQMQRLGWKNGTDEGASGLDGVGPASDPDYNKLLMRNMHHIIKLQAYWRGHSARRLIGMLRAKQLGSSKYFTQEEARETVTKNVYNPN